MQSYADTSFVAVAFNCRAGRAFSAQPIRHAFAVSIDHDSLVAQATGTSNGIPIWGPVNPSSWAYDDAAAARYQQDVSAAAHLLNGAHPSATLLYATGDPAVQRAATLLVQEANAAGFQLTAQGISAATLAQQLSGGGYDLALVQQPVSLDPDLNDLLGSNGSANITGYSSADADAALGLELRATAANLTALQQTRKPDFAQIEHDATNDLPYYFLWSPRHSMGFGATLGGVTSAGVQLDADRDNTFYVNWFLIA